MGVAVMALSLLSGCALTRGCTLIGAESAVFFEFAGRVPESVTTFQARACVADRCVDGSGRRGEPVLLTVPLHSASSEEVVTARLTVRAGSAPTTAPPPASAKPAAVVFDASAEVMLKKRQPNGAGCKPTVYQASVKATEAGTLVAQ